MKHKLKLRGKLKTKKYKKRLLYGGNPPAPAPSSITDIFDRYDPSDVRTTLNNFLQAAYSVHQAALAIKATSDSQNKITAIPTDPTRGSRYLQKDSSYSFTTAADSIRQSLNNLYMALSETTVGPILSPAAAPPTDVNWTPPSSSFL